MIRIFTFLFVIIIFSGCEQDDFQPRSEEGLEGAWLWVESSGGFTGGTNSPESTGNNIRLEITGNQIKTFVNGELTRSSTYTIEVQEVIEGGENEVIIYEDGFFNQSIYLDGNTLTLLDQCYDCYSSVYSRIPLIID